MAQSNSTYNIGNISSSGTISIGSYHWGGGGGGGFSNYSSQPSQWGTISTGGPTYTTSSGWNSYNTSVNIQGDTLSISGNLKVLGSSYFKTESVEISFKDLVENIQEINKVLRIIIADRQLLEDNPTLKDAYDRYNTAKTLSPAYNSEEFIQAYEEYILLEALIKGSNQR